MTTHIFAWTNVTLALAGPALVAWFGTRFEPKLQTMASHVTGLLAITLVVLAVYAWALLGEGYDIQRLGVTRVSWMTPLIAIALMAFFVFVFGPIANWLVAKSARESFSTGIRSISRLPIPYLVLTIVIVAAAEEMLYRGYAIERLADLTGSYLIGSIIAVLAFGLAHVPMWGWAPAATTVVSGGIFTVVYLWLRDVPALILAHIATDICGILLASNLARAAMN